MSEELRDQWSSRPGRRHDRSFYAWHIAFADSAEVAALGATYDTLIRDLSGFVAVPSQALHLPLQGVGFADRVPDTDLVAIVEATRRRIAGLGSFPVTAGPAVLGPESIHLPVRPVQPLQRLRDLTRAAINEVWGHDAVPRLPALDPQITLAYSNEQRPAELVADCLLSHPRHSVTVSITALTLLSLTRGNHVYCWTPHVTLALDEPEAQADEP